MDYLVGSDVESILEIFGITAEELAAELGVTRLTIGNWINGRNDITGKHISELYEYAYGKGIRLNKIKEQLYREDIVHKDELDFGLIPQGLPMHLWNWTVSTAQQLMELKSLGLMSYIG